MLHLSPQTAKPIQVVLAKNLKFHCGGVRSVRFPQYTAGLPTFQLPLRQSEPIAAAESAGTQGSL
jgi:hypothetical protein